MHWNPTPPRAIAQVAYEACRALDNARSDVPFGKPWDELAPEEQESYLEGVELMLRGEDDNGRPVEDASDLRYEWRRRKEAEGWTYGPTRDPVKKTHPNMVEFTELPSEQRRKDHLFFAIVRALQ